MKNVFSILLVFGLFIVSYTARAQKTLDQGTIVMEITNVDSENEMVKLMTGSQTSVYFKGQKHVSYMDMMGGMVQIKVAVDKDNNMMNMLFDMMGQKMWVEAPADKTDPKQDAIKAASKITYDKADKKEILGYNCYKMSVVNPEMEGITLTAYVTEDIKTKANIIQGFETLEFAGYPLEFVMKTPMMTMTMTAQKVLDTVDEEKMKLNTTGYKKMTMEEFQKSMSAMGAGGFGN